MTPANENLPKNIILLHDLSGMVTYLRKLKTVLTWCFPEARVIVPKEPNTISTSIDQQAANVFAQLQHHEQLSLEDPLVLVGHSQGGLRGHALLRNFGDRLNIRGLVTMSTPWEGAPIITCSPEDLQRFLTLLRKSRLPNIIRAAKQVKRGTKAHTSPAELANALEKLYARARATEHLGIVDMRPGSDFLQDTAAHLVTHTTPILAIAGGPSDLVGAVWPDISNPAKRIMDRLQRGYMEGLAHILGSPDHDLTIPVYSQSAQHTAVDNAALTRYFIAGAIHSHAPGIRLKNMITEHPAALAQVIAFIESC